MNLCATKKSHRVSRRRRREPQRKEFRSIAELENIFNLANSQAGQIADFYSPFKSFRGFLQKPIKRNDYFSAQNDKKSEKQNKKKKLTRETLKMKNVSIVLRQIL